MTYGTGTLGRLTYRTAEEARGAARDLGLSGIHSHMQDGERVWMPGRTHARLSKALREQGLPPAPKPSEREMSEEMEKGAFEMEMDDNEDALGFDGNGGLFGESDDEGGF